jgi:insertion element IS1 protein InsB
VGRRDRATLRKLLEKLKSFKVSMYCTDEYQAYFSEIPGHQHPFGKDLTYQLEQNNARQRHWFARFTRRGQVVTRAKNMIDVTLKLFSYYILQGHQNELIEKMKGKMINLLS